MLVAVVAAVAEGNAQLSYLLLATRYQCRKKQKNMRAAVKGLQGSTTILRQTSDKYSHYAWLPRQRFYANC